MAIAAATIHIGPNLNASLIYLLDPTKMVIAAATVILPLGFLFFLSGPVVNFLQTLCFVLIRPWLKNTYRMINRRVAELLWLELLWIVDWWAGVKIKVYTDSETFKLMGKEHALVVSNHKSAIDWLVAIGLPWLHISCHEEIIKAPFLGLFEFALLYLLPTYFHLIVPVQACVHYCFYILKVIGWSMLFSDYLFLERSWAKDENTLKAGFQRLSDFPRTFWLALFIEGTRFTQAKLLAAQEYASSARLPFPKNVLIPRTKGFVTAVSHMRSYMPAVYDIIVAIPKSSPPPTMLRLFKGQSSVVHVHIKRHLMKDLLETDDAVAQWCKDAFVSKDKLLDKHNEENTFPDQLHDAGCPVKSLLIVGFWAILLILGALKFVHHFALFSSWKGVTFSAVVLAVTILIQFLIQFSQAERSTLLAKRTSSNSNSQYNG